MEALKRAQDVKRNKWRELSNPDKLEETGILRDEKGRILPGQKSLNPLGRGAGQTLKEYDAKRFKNMPEEEKEKFLSTISPELRYRMAEGNPKQDTEVSGELKFSPIYGGKSKKQYKDVRAMKRIFKLKKRIRAVRGGTAAVKQSQFWFG